LGGKIGCRAGREPLYLNFDNFAWSDPEEPKSDPEETTVFRSPKMFRYGFYMLNRGASFLPVIVCLEKLPVACVCEAVEFGSREKLSEKKEDSFLYCCFLHFPSEYKTSNRNHQFVRDKARLFTKETFPLTTHGHESILEVIVPAVAK
jgi:hypothetical protein